MLVCKTVLWLSCKFQLIVDIKVFILYDHTTVFRSLCCLSIAIVQKLHRLRLSICLSSFLPFCLTFLHMVESNPGKCSLGFSCLQSVIGKEVLSKGSAHFGSPSDRQTQHFIDSPEKKNTLQLGLFVFLSFLPTIFSSFFSFFLPYFFLSLSMLSFHINIIILVEQRGRLCTHFLHFISSA